MAEVVEHLPSKCEVLSSIPSTEERKRKEGRKKGEREGGKERREGGQERKKERKERKGGRKGRKEVNLVRDMQYLYQEREKLY
jgi:hypothetical protein